MKLTPEEKAGMSPAEIEALEGADADVALATMGDTVPERAVKAEAHGNDDDDTDTDDDGAAQEATAEVASDGEQAQDTDTAALTAEQLAAIAKDTGAELPPRPTTYDVATRDFAAERKELRESRRALQTQWDEGELSDADLQAKLDEVDDKLDALAAAKARAETLTEINEQNRREAAAKIEAEENAATIEVIKAAKASATARVDYLNDKAAQTQFDLALSMLRADPANTSKSPTQLVQQAHKSVLAIRGLPIGAQAPAPTPTPTPAATQQKQRQAARDVPVTLGGLPTAAQVPMQDEALAQASRLSGEDLEQYLARLTPAQQQKLLRSVDNQAFH